MATIGLDKLYYAKITEDTSGNETYEDPLPLAKAMPPSFPWNWRKLRCMRTMARRRW